MSSFKAYLKLTIFVDNLLKQKCKYKMLSFMIHAAYEGSYRCIKRGLCIFLQCRYLHASHESPKKAFHCSNKTSKPLNL